MTKKQTTSLKIVLFGSSAVGKTALIQRFVNHKFITDYDPTIDEESRTTRVVNDVICTLDIQDTCGSDQFETVREMYVRESQGVMLVCSAIIPVTFTELSNYYDLVEQYKEPEKRATLLVVNKIDLECRLDMDKVMSYAESIGAPMITTSAKNNTNVNEAFEMLIKRVLEANPPKKKKFCNLL